MNPGSLLFSNGDVANTLNQQFTKITNAIAGWDEDALLSVPERDVCEFLEQQFLIEPVIVHRDGITTDSVEEGAREELVATAKVTPIRARGSSHIIGPC